MNPSTWTAYYLHDDPAVKLLPAFSQARRLHETRDSDSFTVPTIPAAGYVAVKPFCCMQAGSHFSRRVTFAVTSGEHSLILTTAGPVPRRSGNAVDLGEDYTAELVGDGSKFVDGGDGTIHVLEPGSYRFETAVSMVP